jgi:3-dehydroquinate dehydratase I
MTAENAVKEHPGSRCEIVGVIATLEDLALALSMADPPDLFELRLDHLHSVQDEVEQKIAMLPAPLIATARDPAEGGANKLAATRRRELLARFLPYVRYVDIELRSAESFHSFLNSLPYRDVARILSLHNFDSTPTPRSLHAKARIAKSLGAAIFKVATRTDTPAQLARLLEYISHDEVPLPVSVMGVGKLGALSRIVLAGCGSVMAYASLAEKQLEGQPSVQQLREAFRVLDLG